MFKLPAKAPRRGKLVGAVYEFLLVLIVFYIPLRCNAEGTQESATLTQIGEALNTTEKYPRFDPWEQLVDSCTWRYVTCSGTHTSSITLNNLELQGTLKALIGEITELEVLSLRNNRIHGSIPSSVGQLAKLQSLDLSNNSFSGSVPASLADIATLTYLNLTHNNLSGAIPNALVARFSCSSFVGNAEVCADGCPSVLPNCTLQGGFAPPPPPPSTPPSAPPPPPAAAKAGGGSSSTGAIAGAVAGGVAAVVLLLALLLWWRSRKRAEERRKRKLAETLPVVDPLEHAVTSRHYGQLKRYTLAEMRAAAREFHKSMELGEGGFGMVYKGVLPDGSVVAIKRLKESKKKTGDAQFLNELEVISRAIHKNLLRLEGFCIERGERMLVFPFMAHGSVADHLRRNKRSRGGSKERRTVLAWSTRMRIALGTAEGLAYMHYDCSPKLIHRDVKAANVLLDDNNDAVLADFGLTKLMNYNDTHVTTAVRGTVGHIAPEYLLSGQTSEKTDVFGFGVFLLELASGQGAYDLSLAPERQDLMLRDWIVMLLMEGSVMELVDADLRGDGMCDVQELVQMLQVAIFCMLAEPSERPTMTECVTLLQGRELAEKWQQWRTEVADDPSQSRQDPRLWSTHSRQMADSMEAVHLSGPR